MTLLTPLYGFPSPEMDEPPDGVDQIEDFALTVETVISTPSVLTWVPNWSSAGSPQPTNPSGLTGRYTLVQGWCDFSLVMSLGGSSTGGAGQWRWQLPVTAANINEQMVDGKLWEPQVGNFPLQGIIFGNANLLWGYAPVGGADMNYGALQQRNPSNTAGTHIPINNPGPLQAGGNIIFTGRYLTA